MTLVVPHRDVHLHSYPPYSHKPIDIYFVTDEPIEVPEWAAKAYYDLCPLILAPKATEFVNNRATCGEQASPNPEKARSRDKNDRERARATNRAPLDGMLI